MEIRNVPKHLGFYSLRGADRVCDRRHLVDHRISTKLSTLGEKLMPPRVIVIEYTPSGVDAAYQNAQRMLEESIRDPHSKLYNVPDPGGRERAAHAHNNALADGIVKGAPESGVPIRKRVI